MADFTRQRQFNTREATLLVDKGLPLGIHTFELVVMDASGNQSKAAQVRIEIVGGRVPITPVTPVLPIGPVIPVRPVITPVTPVTPRRPGRPPRPG